MYLNNCWRTGWVQSRKKHHRTDHQPSNPVLKVPPTSAESVPCLHWLQNSLWQSMAWSLMGHHAEVQYQAFEMRFYRRLLSISYKDHVTNGELRRKIQAAIGEYDELLTLIKKRKLRWFGHVPRSSGLAKTIIQGTVKGKKKKRQTEEEVGRQYQRVDRNGLCQLNKGSWKQVKMERHCCEFICGAPTTFQGYGIE